MNSRTFATALVVFATLRAAHAGLEAPTPTQPCGRLPDPALVVRPLSDDCANLAWTVGSGSPGGAVYNPFSKAPGSDGQRDAATKRNSGAEDADFTFTVIAALAGIGLFGYILRRAWHAH